MAQLIVYMMEFSQDQISQYVLLSPIVFTDNYSVTRLPGLNKIKVLKQINFKACTVRKNTCLVQAVRIGIEDLHNNVIWENPAYGGAVFS